MMERVAYNLDARPERGTAVAGEFLHRAASQDKAPLTVMLNKVLRVLRWQGGPEQADTSRQF